MSNKFMKNNGSYPLVLLLLATLFSLTSHTLYEDEEFIFGDLLPDAPELAERGKYGVGVRTVNLVNKDQINVLKLSKGTVPTYDRPLTVEVWYPAIIPESEKEIAVYDHVLGVRGEPERPLLPYTFKGRSLRKAQPETSGAPYPLVILSHGYPGSRLIFTYLAENLASKGYVVASIGHTESTYRDKAAISSTLLNRSLDQLFVLNEIARLSETENNNFLSGLVEATNTAIIGYSMGGYGVLNVAGAGYSDKALATFKSMTESHALKIRTTGSETYIASQDARIKAVVAFAPWGMEKGIWDSLGLAGLKTPTLFIAGSEDDVSGYEQGVKAIYEGAVNADRYMLTYLNARHNVAPNPPPPESLKQGLHLDEYLRYADSVWDEKRINNINQHFIR